MATSPALKIQVSRKPVPTKNAITTKTGIGMEMPMHFPINSKIVTSELQMHEVIKQPSKHSNAFGEAFRREKWLAVSMKDWEVQTTETTSENVDADGEDGMRAWSTRDDGEADDSRSILTVESASTMDSVCTEWSVSTVESASTMYVEESVYTPKKEYRQVGYDGAGASGITPDKWVQKKFEEKWTPESREMERREEIFTLAKPPVMKEWVQKETRVSAGFNVQQGVTTIQRMTPKNWAQENLEKSAVPVKKESQEVVVTPSSTPKKWMQESKEESRTLASCGKGTLEDAITPSTTPKKWVQENGKWVKKDIAA
jgi:hypothetical protein